MAKYQEIHRELFVESQIKDIRNFLEEMRANGKSEKTIRTYEYSIEKLADVYNKPFKEITKEEIIDFVNSIETETTKGLIMVWTYGIDGCLKD